MHSLFLSGVGGSTFWLPLILPLLGILAIIYLVDFIVKFVRKRKLAHENRLAHDNFSTTDSSDNSSSDI
jgi:hypothetical protein